MPLPLPNLDNRRWADLVDEGRALVPRYARAWTDHNVHDPGITLIELFAYLVEGLLYRVNRVPERHRRKFMALAGFVAAPPCPAMTVVQGRLHVGAGRVDLPEGTILSAQAEQGEVQFSTHRAATLFETELRAVQVFDGASFSDRTRPALSRVPFPALGSNPTPSASAKAESAPALYLGFDRALPTTGTLSLFLRFLEQLPDELARLRVEGQAEDEFCGPRPPELACRPCPPPRDPWCASVSTLATTSVTAVSTAADAIPSHHAARVSWDYYALDGWRLLSPDAGEVEDRTRSLTLDGAVHLTAPGPMAARRVGAVAEPLYYVRCRLSSGQFDAAPVIHGVIENGILVSQRVPAWGTLPLARGAAVTAPSVGARQALDLTFDTDGRIVALKPAVADDRLRVYVLDFAPPTATAEGAITVSAERVLVGSGLPEQSGRLVHPQVADAQIEVAAIESSGWTRWESRADFDSSSAIAPHFTLDPSDGHVRFGNGVRGRTVPDLAPVLAAYASTRGSEGNVREGLSWSIAENAWNEMLLAGGGTTVATANARIRRLGNPYAAADGSNREPLQSVERRAAEVLWAHERLTQLAPVTDPVTLDQTPREDVMSRAAPRRATTLLDFERLALDVPGTRVRRARAWANLDPSHPCLDAAGTVTVVVVPELPLTRPRPSRGLLRVVRGFLDRRRVLCTRLVVVGPEYLVVTVKATVQAFRNADPERVRASVLEALDRFLHPLHGGPAGLGWPFGRDIYRSEIMALLDGVPGVDHVVNCVLAADDRDALCGNLCLPSTWLVASGEHAIEVVRS